MVRTRSRRKTNPQAQMALKEHLREFRNRFLRAAAATVIASVAGFFLYTPVMAAIQEPLQRIAEDPDRQVTINYSAVGSPFDLLIQVSLTMGLVLASPVWLYQLWAFLLPALRPKEKWYAVGFVLSSILLFLGGVVVAWFCMPVAVMTLTMFTPPEGANIIEAKNYIAFILRLLISFGISFVIPVVLFGLNLLGLLRGRTILKSWRWVVVLVALLAAMTTPGTDVLTMFYLMAPLLILFFLAVGLCLLNDRKRDRREAELAAGIGVDADQATSDQELRAL